MQATLLLIICQYGCILRSIYPILTIKRSEKTTLFPIFMHFGCFHVKNFFHHATLLWYKAHLGCFWYAKGFMAKKKTYRSYTKLLNPIKAVNGTRTRALRLTKATLYHLSYNSTVVIKDLTNWYFTKRIDSCQLFFTWTYVPIMLYYLCVIKKK